MREFNPTKVLLVYEPGVALEKVKVLIRGCFKGKDIFIKLVVFENIETEKEYGKTPDFIVVALENFSRVVSKLSTVFPTTLIVDGTQKLTPHSFKKQ